MWRVAPVPVTVSYQVEGTLGPSPLGTGDTSTLILRRAGHGGYDRNSNLLTAVDSVMGQWNYTYDNLNRLTTAQASALPAGLTLPGSYGCWSFDPFGNRTAEAWQNTACPTPASSLAPTATYNSGNQLSWTSVNAAGSNVTYDPAGNMTYDGKNSYLYDAEGRVCAVQEVVNGTNFLTGYIYDAGGTRVAKGSLQSLSCNFSSNGFTTNTSWVLGPGGEQVTEYAVSGGASTWTHTNVFAGGKLLATYNGSDTYFALEDWLGSKRVEIDATGHCAATFASLPFGNTPSNGNSYQLGTLPGYQLCGDATEHHFTGKERDTESGNDYFDARYYSSSMGRFMSPDWSAKMEPVPYAKLDDPQSLNLYAYVLNSPLVHLDPDGHDGVILNASGLAGGYGHNASMVGNDKEGWTYFSKDGSNTTNRAISFKTFSEFEKSTVSGGYDRAFRVPTTPAQDAKMKAAGMKDYNKPYSVEAKKDVNPITKQETGTNKSENCGDLTATVLGAGGVKIEKPTSYVPGIGTFTSPNKQFDQVEKDNKSGTVITPHCTGPNCK